VRGKHTPQKLDGKKNIREREKHVASLRADTPDQSRTISRFSIGDPGWPRDRSRSPTNSIKSGGSKLLDPGKHGRENGGTLRKGRGGGEA